MEPNLFARAVQLLFGHGRLVEGHELSYAGLKFLLEGLLP